VQLTAKNVLEHANYCVTRVCTSAKVLAELKCIFILQALFRSREFSMSLSEDELLDDDSQGVSTK